MNLLNKKARRDLFGNPSRILMVFLAMLLGTTIFGTITFTEAIINRELEAEYSATNPASASILVDRIDDNLIQLIDNFDEISDYEIGAAYDLAVIRPDGILKKMQLFSSLDYAKRHINRVTPVEGSFAPSLDEILLDSDALGVARAKLGDTITLRMPDESLQHYKISGLVNDLSQHPPSVHDEVYAYVSSETLAQMGLSMNRIDYLITGNVYDRSQILNTSRVLISLLEKAGYHINTLSVAKTPGISMHRDEYKGALFIFQAFSIVAFLFGCIIMNSLFSTLLAGQVKQIGVLKSMGGKTQNIIRSYIGASLLLIMGNAVLSLPLAYVGARWLSIFFMSLGNMRIHNFAVPIYLLIVFCIIGIVVPFILALIPIRRGLSITVKAAISHLGLSTHRVKKDKLSQLLEKKVARPVLFSLRNAMEKRRRFTMNVAMLTLGGLMFTGIVGATLAINGALAKSMSAQQYDYQIITTPAMDEAKLNPILKAYERVSNYEIWGQTTGKIIYSDGNTGNNFTFSSPSKDTQLYKPNLMEGRWFEPTDTHGIIVSFNFFEQEPSYSLGSLVSFQLGDTISELEIIGVIYEIGGNTIYMSPDCYKQLVPESTKLNSVNLVTVNTSGRPKAHYNSISQYFSDNDIPIIQAFTKSDKSDIVSGHFAVTLNSFLIVAILAVAIATLGLATTMNVQVKERTREIGILKSVGATTKQVFSIITAESLYTCLFSFVICLILGIPFTALAIQIIGVSVLEIPLGFSPLSIACALAVWLVVTFIVGQLASRKAAKEAVRLTVKNALSLE